ncbi:MAG: PEP-CTERM sorting domain-containing protein [Pseudomonadaceae bacterium]|nr:PEP-CTERM sorting domain-containing protein [Pseudomonadaceae bacterium]
MKRTHIDSKANKRHGPHRARAFLRRAFTTALAVSFLSASASAALIVELAERRDGGTQANFWGAGTTNGAFEFNLDAHGIGDFVLPTGPDNSWFDLANPVEFADGFNLERVHIDYNPDSQFDDLRLGLSDFVPTRIDYDIQGSSLVSGLAFSSLIPGSYGASQHPDVNIVGGLSLVVTPLSVPEPASIALFTIGLVALTLSRRRRSQQG